jgi:ribosomal protein S18 acetylase RimI-like enzyme
LGATWRDLGPALELERACFGKDAWPWIDVLAALSLPGTVRLKAEAADRLIGLAVGERWSGHEQGWIASLAVHPDYQRRGIGRRLLGACEQALGTRRIRLTVRVSNRAAIELYRGSDYIPVEVWRRYYSDGEDAQVMEKDRRVAGG